MSKKKKKDNQAKIIKEQNLKETVRLLEWARNSSGLWDALCNSEKEPINMEAFNALRDSIIENHFYYLLPVLMTVHQNCGFVKSATRYIYLDSLIRDLKSGNYDSVVQTCIEHTK